MKHLKYISCLLVIAAFSISCKTVSITGRNQLNQVPNTLITTMSFSAYETVVKTSPILSSRLAILMSEWQIVLVNAFSMPLRSKPD